MQNVGDVQETEVPAPAGEGADHMAPSKVEAPVLDTAAQNVIAVQEIAAGQPPARPLPAGLPHEVPLKARTFTLSSMAMQKVELVQETEVRPCPASILGGSVQPLP